MTLFKVQNAFHVSLKKLVFCRCVYMCIMLLTTLSFAFYSMIFHLWKYGSAHFLYIRKVIYIYYSGNACL